MDEMIFLPPQNIEAERQIIGAVMFNNKALTSVRELLPIDFYKPTNGEIFKAMLNLSDQGEPIDFVSMAGKAEHGYLVQCVTETPTSANIAYHARIVKDLSQRRQLVRICQDVFQSINERTLDESLSLLRNETQALVRGHGGQIMSMKDVAKEVLKYVESRKENPSAVSGISSGFRDIDAITDGFQNGDFIILAARPSKGKSALAMSVAQNAQVPVGMISLEMGPHQLGIRTLSSLSQVELYKLRKGFFGRESMGDIHNAIIQMAEMEVYFSFASRNTAEIEKVVTQMVESCGIKMLMLDYLQLAKSVDTKKREQEVAEVSRLCKGLALAHNIPVLALAQLNRDSEKEKRKPILADLRESGQIEQDADVVIFIYEDPKEKAENVIDILFAKGRNIGLGEVKLIFDRDTMTFRDYERPKEGRNYE